MNSDNDFETFNKYLKAAYFKKAAEFAKDRQFDTAQVKEAALDEYNLCTKAKKYHWALEIAVNFKLEKSKIKKVALNEYNELTKENNRSCRGAAQLAIDYNLGRDKVVSAAEKALDYFIRIQLYDEAEDVIKRFGLNSDSIQKRAYISKERVKRSEADKVIPKGFRMATLEEALAAIKKDTVFSKNLFEPNGPFSAVMPQVLCIVKFRLFSLTFRYINSNFVLLSCWSQINMP